MTTATRASKKPATAPMAMPNVVVRAAISNRFLNAVIETRGPVFPRSKNEINTPLGAVLNRGQMRCAACKSIRARLQTTAQRNTGFLHLKMRYGYRAPSGLSGFAHFGTPFPAWVWFQVEPARPGIGVRRTQVCGAGARRAATGDAEHIEFPCVSPYSRNATSLSAGFAVSLPGWRRDEWAHSPLFLWSKLLKTDDF